MPRVSAEAVNVLVLLLTGNVIRMFAEIAGLGKCRLSCSIDSLRLVIIIVRNSSLSVQIMRIE